MLTNEDRAELDRIQIAWTNSPASSDGTNGMRVLLETIAVHFLAAGAARARPAPAAEDDTLVADLRYIATEPYEQINDSSSARLRQAADVLEAADAMREWFRHSRTAKPPLEAYDAAIRESKPTAPAQSPER
jgi:hypothetical protein